MVRQIASWIVLTAVACWAVPPIHAQERESIPEKLVVLTFDDAVKSHYTVVRPLLKKYQFGATFFVTEGFDFSANKQDYMTWEQIAELHRDGFEIGNHTRDHLSITDETADHLEEQLAGIAARCDEYQIPRPISFAWPGNALSAKAFDALRQHGIRFARRGGAPEYEYKNGQGFAYEPGLDHPFLIPSAGDARPTWELEDFQQAVHQARFGRIAVLQFHGVPDNAHPWVNLSPEKFELFLRYLADHHYQVIAMRDLSRYVNADLTPDDPFFIIEDRRRLIRDGKSIDEFRTPASDSELQFWLENMLVHHQFSSAEAAAATGMTPEQIEQHADRLKIHASANQIDAKDRLLVLPYPGGRHPRIGFRDGAIRPQRETKLSIFLPWMEHRYVVADIPEAIWWEAPEGRELLYLAHTHVPTTWDKRGIELPAQEWQRTKDGWQIERQLPNGVKFGARARPAANEVKLELWIENGSDETLRGLLVQNCVMLGAAPGFDKLENENKIFQSPFVACGDESRNRWIITGWESCKRPWGNPPCPCMHSDPQFPDCPPGERRLLHGVVAFYEGADIEQELARRTAAGWLP